MRSDTLFMVGGCSGSLPAPSENRPVYDAAAPRSYRRVPFRRELYGSRTTCFFLRHKNTFIVVDNGIGVEPVSEFILDMIASESIANPVVHCLQTHFHEDHLDGLRANALILAKQLTLRFYSPMLSALTECAADDGDNTYTEMCPLSPTMEDVHGSLFCESYWPVTLEKLAEFGAKREYETFLPGSELSIGEVRVSTLPLRHPGGCIGYLLAVPGVGSVVIATDYEPPPNPEPEFVELISGARLVMCDMQYRDDEYAGKRAIGGRQENCLPRSGWGHGTPNRVLPALLQCKQHPEMVRIVHHDPKRPDMDLRLFYEESTSQLEQMNDGPAIDFRFAHDGNIYWL